MREIQKIPDSVRKKSIYNLRKRLKMSGSIKEERKIYERKWEGERERE